MRIKVFKAPTLKEAMAQVKLELGIDAVILHTKRYRKGGFLGYKSKEIVEVTAAIEDPEKKVRRSVVLPKPAEPILPPAVPRNVLAQYKTAGTSRIAAPMVSAAAPVSVVSPVPVSSAEQAASLPKGNVPLQAVEPEAARPRIIKADQQVMPAFVPVQETDTPKEAATEPDSAVQTEKIHALEEELVQMKDMLTRVMSQEVPESSVVTLRQALREQEVAEPVLKDMVSQMTAGAILADKSSSAAREALEKYLKKAIHVNEGISLENGKVKIVALIGATGVGKTTTLAKIAARFVLEKGVSMALITADTYRISAVEQLKTYSDIIGLPLEIVYSPEELKKAIHKYRNKQLILIDTAGRSQYNDYQMQELNELLAVEPDIEKHLVMSSTTKSRDALDILEKFSACQPDCVLFTKTDETSSLGIILNLLHEKKIALSYLTNGQSVPDDILPANVEALTELLLR